MLHFELKCTDKLLPAAKFNIVAQPNDWAKAIRQRGRGSNEATDLQLLQQEFWNKVREYGEENGKHVRSWRNPLPKHWYNVSIGSSRAHLSAKVNSREMSVALDLYIKEDADLFRALESKRTKIESELGYALEWLGLPENKASIIRVRQSGDFQDEDKQDALVKWIVDKAEEFAKVFRKYL